MAPTAPPHVRNSPTLAVVAVGEGGCGWVRGTPHGEIRATRRKPRCQSNTPSPPPPFATATGAQERALRDLHRDLPPGLRPRQQQVLRVRGVLRATSRRPAVLPAQRACARPCVHTQDKQRAPRAALPPGHARRRPARPAAQPPYHCAGLVFIAVAAGRRHAWLCAGPVVAGR